MLLARVGLEGFEERETSTMSGGELQRLAIASALARSPRLLVSDEATAMIDRPGREEVVNLLRTLASSGIAVVHVTHRVEEAAVADEVLDMTAADLGVSNVPSAPDLLSLALSPKPTMRFRPISAPGVARVPTRARSAARPTLASRPVRGATGSWCDVLGARTGSCAGSEPTPTFTQADWRGACHRRRRCAVG